MSDIRTPWGSIFSKVSLFPIYYLIFIYGFVYILPFGKNFIGSTWFDLLKKEDGPLEWLQFSQFFISSIMGLFIFYKSKKKRSMNSLIWLIFSIFCFLISAEEISWGERITGFTLNSISDLSIQGETNFHNLPFFHNVLLDPLLHVLCIFLGWVGWRKWPNLSSLPSKKFSLFFYSYLYFLLIMISLGLQQFNILEMIKKFSNFYYLLGSFCIFGRISNY